MSDCDGALEQLYTYLDGELTEDRRVDIQAHLDSCGDCFGAFDFEAEVRQVVAHRCRDEVPEALRTRIADALSAERAEAD